MKNKYTIGAMIGNAISPHILEVMQGICQAAKSMDADVLFFLGIHCGFYYKLNEQEDIDKDFDYQFNTVYDYQSFADIDALIIEYGSLGMFLNEADQKEFLHKFDNIPRVILEERAQSDRATAIITDNYHGMYSIAEHLVRDHGYRDITYLAGPKGNTDADEREKAVRAVMNVYQIPFDESRILYGNFSSNVQKQVNELLDRFPHMEAMICANDNMADTAYKECFRRGLTVGRDIAITGYDDWELAGLMDPPLTTVLQNANDMGYMAVIGALELCKGRRSHTVVVPARLKLRESCGCCKKKILPSEPGHTADTDWHLRSEEKIKEILKEVFSETTRPELKLRFARCLQELLGADFRTPASEETVRTGLQRLMDDQSFAEVSSHALSQLLEQYVDDWLEAELNAASIDRPAVHNLLLRKRQIHEKSVCHMVRSEKERMTDFLHESCFLPLISRDMLCYIEDETELYKSALTKLAFLNAANSYLYILKEPIVHYKGDRWNCPDTLYLAACQEGREVYSYRPEERPVITLSSHSGGPLSVRHPDDIYSAEVLCLFSGEVQYGILVAEIDPANTVLFYLISREIGNMLRLYQLSKEQMLMRQKQEQLIQEIQEKNQVLNFISESDPLTGCLNRRGFMEKVLQLNREKEGAEALLCFADLDHLKEINDVFGHAAGDFAIKWCGAVLQKQAGGSGIVGRIGGDEFCVLLSGNAQMGHDFVEQIKAKSAAFNAISEKDYYVELSIGFTPVTLGKNFVISEKLSAADQALYEEKKKRRTSICKCPR